MNSTLAALNRGMGGEVFQKKLSIKNVAYAVVNAWNTVTKDTVVHV